MPESDLTPVEIPDPVLHRVRIQRRWRAAAWHQAGHAVVRLALGYGVNEVNLTPLAGDRLGTCEYDWPVEEPGLLLPPERWPPRRRRAEVLTLLAGAAAERLCTGGSVESRGYATDYRSAQAIAASAGADGLLGRAEREAVALVCRHRGPIAAVAEALLRSDTLRLTGPEVKAAAEAARVPRLAGAASGEDRPAATAHVGRVPSPE